VVRRARIFWSPQRIANITVVAAVLVVIISQLHPTLLLSKSMDSGGDTAGHIVPAWYLMNHLGTSLTSWSPDWYDGFPLYTYYFILPNLFAAVAGHIIPFAVAFKLSTVLGTLLMPIAAFTMGKLFRAPDPVPAALAAATLPFLFDANWTIDGGNIFSTMAGEYSFSLSLACALVTIGLFARGVRTHKGRWLAALMLAVTLAAHILPWFWVLAMVVFITIYEMADFRGFFDRSRGQLPRHHGRRTLWWAASAGFAGVCLSAWWLLPFVTSQQYVTELGYTNIPTDSFGEIFSQLGWWPGHISPSNDRLYIVLAAVAFVVAVYRRDRLGLTLSVSAVGSMLAFIWDPQSAIYNQRLVPFWFISIYLLVGWLAGTTLLSIVRGVQRWSNARSHDQQDSESVRREFDAWKVTATFVVALLAVVTVLPGIIWPITQDNEVTNWTASNFTGYQGQSGWKEFKSIYTTLDRVAKRYGCGRAMWEYDESELNRFGSTMSLMSLPLWTNGCIDSMEGTYFESSATTPYHFFDQAELSLVGSCPITGLYCGQLDVKLGVEHLQLLGVKYYVAFTPETVAQANADPSLKLVAVTENAPPLINPWHIYLVRHSPLVAPLSTLPQVIRDINSRVTWFNDNAKWWQNPKDWDVFLAADGPADWPRLDHANAKVHIDVPTTTVTDVHLHDQSISFNVGRLGTPVLVKISYYPRWHAQGALGPYRVSPNLMVVVPTRHHVELTYGSDTAVTVGDLISLVAGVCLLVAIWRVRWWRRPRVNRAPAP
jgi:hypothetical protein